MLVLSRKIFHITIILFFFIDFAISTNLVRSEEKTLREKIVKDAKEFIGLEYRFGGISAGGFDCSGFVRHIYKKNGIDVPRRSFDQYYKGKKIKMKNIKSGDLVFFKINLVKITHVGIFIGDGKFIHSPSSGKNVRVSDIKNSYWKKRLHGAVKYIN